MNKTISILKQSLNLLGRAFVQKLLIIALFIVAVPFSSDAQVQLSKENARLLVIYKSMIVTGDSLIAVGKKKKPLSEEESLKLTKELEKMQVEGKYRSDLLYKQWDVMTEETRNQKQKEHLKYMKSIEDYAERSGQYCIAKGNSMKQEAQKGIDRINGVNPSSNNQTPNSNNKAPISKDYVPIKK